MAREARSIDLNAELAPLKSFILPGGSAAAAYLHLARTVCRRGERLMVELNDKPGEGVTPAALKYVNRLSDFLFVAGRHANDQGCVGRVVEAGTEPVMTEQDPSAMVMPIYDDNPFTQPIKPLVSWCLIALNLGVFFYEAGASQLALERMIDTFSLTPAALVGDMPRARLGSRRASRS